MLILSLQKLSVCPFNIALANFLIKMCYVTGYLQICHNLVHKCIACPWLAVAITSVYLLLNFINVYILRKIISLIQSMSYVSQ